MISVFHACDEVNILEYQSVGQEPIENMKDNEIYAISPKRKVKAIR